MSGLLFPELDPSYRTREAARTLARINDPATSKAAAAQAAPMVSAHEALILDALRPMGARGGTKDELAAATGLDDVAVARRMAALKGKGLVVVAGVRELPTGRMGTAWRAC